MSLTRNRWTNQLFEPANKTTVRFLSVATMCLIIYNFKLWDNYGGTITAGSWQGLYEFSNLLYYRRSLILIGILFIFGIFPRTTGLGMTALLLPLLFEPIRPQSRLVLLVTLTCLTLSQRNSGKNPAPMWPLFLIQTQLCLIYGVNALAKMTPHYLSGDVLIAMSQTLPNFLVDMNKGFYQLGPLKISASMAAWSSVIVEAYLAIGFWFPPLRWLSAIVGILFHFQLQTIIKIGILDWVSMFLYLIFLMPIVAQPKDHS